MSSSEGKKAIPTVEEIVVDLKNNPRYRKFFDKLDSKTVDDFIKRYSEKKHYLYQFGTYTILHKPDFDEKWTMKAAGHLEIIQQKKLFDKQCQWSAEQITIPCIQLCCDFMYWEDRIMQCDFIEPVSEDDIQLYSNYLLQLGSDELEFDSDFEWQHYDELKEQHVGDGLYGLPPWYEYHNMVTRNSQYLLFENIRGNKEEFYRNLYFDSERKSDYNPHSNVSVMDFEDMAENFILKFEDTETKYNYKMKQYHDSYDDETDEISEDLIRAEDCTEIVIGFNFRDTVIKTHNRYKAIKIAEYLPYAFDQYQLDRSMGFNTEVEPDRYFQLDIKANYVRTIIAGRLLNGEPGDLNF